MKEDNNPILVGKVMEYEKNKYSLSGHFGEVCDIDFSEYAILKEMNGFKTFSEISKITSFSERDVNSVFLKYKDKSKYISTLAEWNELSWCEECRTYGTSDFCELCGKKAKRIVFLPPGDPWIALETERKFLISVFADRYKIPFDNRDIFIINNGIDGKQFFWEVAYAGEIVLKITFCNQAPDTWKYELLIDKEKIVELEGMRSDEQKKMILANKYRQENLISKAEAFIKYTRDIYDVKPLIYFSGGKESMVMYSLYKRFGIPANVLMVSGGVEFPEDYEFMNKCRKLITRDALFELFYYEDDGKRIIQQLKEQGGLSADDPWCRNNFKRKMKVELTKKIYGKCNFVACEGSRWHENDFRRRHPKIQVIKEYPFQLWTHPIAEWTYFDVWIYMLSNNLPINPMYYLGFQRTTCWMCPIVNPFHIYCSQKRYPNLWEEINGCSMNAFNKKSPLETPF